MSDGGGAITPPYSTISDAALTAGKPFTQTLARTIRDNIEHVHKLVHDPLAGHNHDGANSPLVSVAASVVLAADTILKDSGIAARAWTTVSIAADTGAQTAKVAVLHVHVFGTTTGLPGDTRVELRKTGTAPSAPPFVQMDLATDSSGSVDRTIFVPLDGSERFDFQVTNTGSNISWTIHLDGWLV